MCTQTSFVHDCGQANPTVARYCARCGQELRSQNQDSLTSIRSDPTPAVSVRLDWLNSQVIVHNESLVDLLISMLSLGEFFDLNIENLPFTLSPREARSIHVAAFRGRDGARDFEDEVGIESISYMISANGKALRGAATATW